MSKLQSWEARTLDLHLETPRLKLRLQHTGPLGTLVGGRQSEVAVLKEGAELAFPWEKSQLHGGTERNQPARQLRAEGTENGRKRPDIEAWEAWSPSEAAGTPGWRSGEHH